MANHGPVLSALLKAAQEELGTDRVIIIAELNTVPVVIVSAGCKGKECGMLAEALLNVDPPLEDVT